MEKAPPGFTVMRLTLKRGSAPPVAATPGTINLAVALVLLRWFCLTHLLHILERRGITSTASLVGHHQVLHTNGRHQLFVTVDVAVVAVMDPRITASTLPCSSFGLTPTAPTKSRRRSSPHQPHHHRIGGFFHDRIVDSSGHSRKCHAEC
jgi:hypothetical protein